MTRYWANYRRSKDPQQLKVFYNHCGELTGEIATFPLFALQQVISSISRASKKQLFNTNDTKAFIKEVDWLMNQLIRGQYEGDNPFLQEKSATSDEGVRTLRFAKSTQPTKSNVKPIIAIIDNQESASRLLQSTLEDFALTAKCYSDIASFESDPDANLTDLVLLDIVMPNVCEIEVFKFAKKIVDKGITVISCSSKFTFETRLLAVRANVSDYVVKPTNTFVLVEKIGRALRLQQRRNHRIAIVDDQEAMGTFYKTMLEHVGCDVTFFPTAHSLFASLDDLNPDMFLLDLMMPEVDGLEVAKMIRQEHKFDYAPILFLTADELIENRLAAISAGADDVINKTSSINTITTQVITRLDRASAVRASVAKDPLTGVLNHGQIVESASQTMRFSERRNTSSVLTVIDVDLFKQVNDTHGHVAGDKVLCALGQLMANSVRETDSVGRYGGEEFVIVFDDCSVDNAASKVQNIKDVFSNIKFNCNGQDFNVTFSAGIVSLNEFDNVQTAISFADKALYRAKDEGRNKVVKYHKR